MVEKYIIGNRSGEAGSICLNTPQIKVEKER
jgi:hypothetical protein